MSCSNIVSMMAMCHNNSRLDEVLNEVAVELFME